MNWEFFSFTKHCQKVEQWQKVPNITFCQDIYSILGRVFCQNNLYWSSLFYGMYLKYLLNIVYLLISNVCQVRLLSWRSVIMQLRASAGIFVIFFMVICLFNILHLLGIDYFLFLPSHYIWFHMAYGSMVLEYISIQKY